MIEFLSKFSFKDGEYSYFNLEEAVSHYGGDIKKIPYTIRILLESLLRRYNGVDVTKNHIEDLATYGPKKTSGEVLFKPSRVILQDFAGVPVVVDLASMRDAIVTNGGDAELINSEIPADLVIDHSVQVDFFGCDTALEDNINLESKRNNERYEFLKWAEKSFDDYRAVPPATGIIHQVNIEFLSDVVIEKNGMLYPDSMSGIDSHTTMINGTGALGWGVGGIEAEAAMLGEASFFPVPEVINARLAGKLPKIATAADLALKVTQVLRREEVVGKFVEYFGDGLSGLSLAERAAIVNMVPEYGATCGYPPIDNETLNYMCLTDRKEDHIALTKEYVKHNNLLYDPEHQTEYTRVVEIDLSTISPSISGPERPQDLINLTQAKRAFQESLVHEVGIQGFGLTADEINKKATVHFDDQDIEIQTGHMAIAAIVSCTNTSNPYVLMSVGLLVKNAVERGLRIAPTVKISLAPGPKVVIDYLRNSGLQTYLDTLGFNIIGYGCTTCIDSSGSLRPEVTEAIIETDLLASTVLSGNRNFEGRVNPLVKASFLAGPPLVVVYALAGNINIGLTTEPLGFDQDNAPVYLKDIMPANDEVVEYVDRYVARELFEQEYEHVFTDSEKWDQIPTEESKIYHWDESSTYIQNPPYFDNLGDDLVIKPLKNLKPSAKFGDSATTDHISSASNTAKNSLATKYLDNRGVDYADFSSYGSRRGNHEVMMRGTFVNIRIQDQLIGGKISGYTKYNDEIMPIYDAAVHYKEDNVDTLVTAGRDYGMGSNRDWAAKGSNLLGIKAVLVESFERTHRSNLVMMGVLPLQFLEGDTVESLDLTGLEAYDIDLSENPGIYDVVDVVARDDLGEKHFRAMVHFDADAGIRYYKSGGVLPMVVRKKLEGA